MKTKKHCLNEFEKMEWPQKCSKYHWTALISQTRLTHSDRTV